MVLFNEGGFLCFCYNKAFAKETQEEEGRAKESILVLIILVLHSHCVPIGGGGRGGGGGREGGRNAYCIFIVFLLRSYVFPLEEEG